MAAGRARPELPPVAPVVELDELHDRRVLHRHVRDAVAPREAADHRPAGRACRTPRMSTALRPAARRGRSSRRPRPTSAEDQRVVGVPRPADERDEARHEAHPVADRGAVARARCGTRSPSHTTRAGAPGDDVAGELRGRACTSGCRRSGRSTRRGCPTGQPVRGRCLRWAGTRRAPGRSRAATPARPRSPSMYVAKVKPRRAPRRPPCGPWGASAARGCCTRRGRPPARRCCRRRRGATARCMSLAEVDPTSGWKYRSASAPSRAKAWYAAPRPRAKLPGRCTRAPAAPDEAVHRAAVDLLRLAGAAVVGVAAGVAGVEGDRRGARRLARRRGPAARGALGARGVGAGRRGAVAPEVVVEGVVSARPPPRAGCWCGARGPGGRGGGRGLVAARREEERRRGASGCIVMGADAPAPPMSPASAARRGRRARAGGVAVSSRAMSESVYRWALAPPPACRGGR